MEDILEEFIHFIIDVANDEFDSCISSHVAMKEFLRHGGCLELAQVIQYFVPEAKICIGEDFDYYVVLYNDSFYDAYGRIKEIGKEDKYEAVSSEYIVCFEEKYGHDILFWGKKPHLALIKEIEDCSGNYVDHLLQELNSLSRSK